MDLVIGIPTYNRPKKALNLILKLEKFIDSDTQIMVIENHSENMIDKKKLLNSRIKYFAREINLGLDESILDLIIYAKKK